VEKEARSRLIINELLTESGWTLTGENRNVGVEINTTDESGKRGLADYTLHDEKGKIIGVIEAKSPSKSPLIGKEQARQYSKSLHNRFIILSNSIDHYLWDLEGGNPKKIYQFPTPHELTGRISFTPKKELLYNEVVGEDYIVKTQKPNYKTDPDYVDKKTRGEFIRKNNLVFLRPYQLSAVHSIQESVREGNERFLLEMATGTGKTKTTAGIIKLFLQTENCGRVLFLVDRIELEDQALKAFHQSLKPTFTSFKWKENRDDWKKADIVVSTIQSFTKNNKYKRIFQPNDFDLVISDEAHRSIGGNSRKVFEYFLGYKLGLTATPKDYLKQVDKESLSTNDPRELERRVMMDTYQTFGCESGEPTYRYSLLDGVKDGYLINPIVVDARTQITTKLLSDEGFMISDKDEDGNDIDEIFGSRDFEKKFFSDETNKIFCKTFLDHCLRDPISGEVGKSLIFCVSQKHAAKITNILNKMGSLMFPGKYNSDFAVQITSSIPNAQTFTVNFTNNNLNGESDFSDYYKSSKTRVAVTCSMMTTGYDCEDVLNVCLMKPVFSPSDFIQMKGRGTRKHNFYTNWIDKNNFPPIENPDKVNFKLFDFFGNCEYFEEKFNYDEVLKLPSRSKSKQSDTPPITDLDIYENINPDPLQTLKETLIGVEGMRVDRETFEKFKEISAKDTTIKELHQNREWEQLEEYMLKNVFDKPSEFFNLDKLRKSLGLDRRVSIKELMDYVFNIIPYIKSKDELLDEEYEKFDDRYLPNDLYFSPIKDFFKTYILDKELQDIMDTKQYSRLNFHPAGETFKKIPQEYRTLIPTYIKNHVPLNKFLS
jgi:type I restriction enzyme R subunit